MITAYIGIGSNLGNRRENIEKALAFLENSENIKIIKKSSIYETAPVGGPDQGPYLNGVIEIETGLKPRGLLKRLNEIEDALGRVRIERNGQRTIDLDILLYGGMAFSDDKLTIPHPRMYQRDFVMRGLMEIAPENALCAGERIVQ